MERVDSGACSIRQFGEHKRYKANQVLIRVVPLMSEDMGRTSEPPYLDNEQCDAQKAQIGVRGVELIITSLSLEGNDDSKATLDPESVQRATQTGKPVLQKGADHSEGLDAGMNCFVDMMAERKENERTDSWRE